MPSDDEGPNFGYAYGTGASTWNPALRPESEKLVNGDHAVRPVKKKKSVSFEAGSKPPHEPSTFVTDDAQTLSAEPPSDDDFFDRYGSPDEVPTPITNLSNLMNESEGHVEPIETGTSVEESGPVQHQHSLEQPAADGKPGSGPEVEQSGVSLPLQSMQPGDSMEDGDADDVPSTVPDEVHPADPRDLNAAEDQQPLPSEEEKVPEVDHDVSANPSNHYEHQGEATLLEEAVDESAKEPLVDDMEPPPTSNWDDTDTNFSIGQELGNDAQPEVTHALPETQDEALAQPDVDNSGFDWGAPGAEELNGTEENDAFAGLGLTPAVEAGEPLLGESQQEKEAEDVDAAWADAFGDDDFLSDPVNESVDPSAFFDDGAGFLDEGDATTASAPTLDTTHLAQPGNRYAPPSASSTYSQSQQPYSSSRASASPFSPSPAFSPYQQQVPTRPSLNSSAQSFVAKSKGGYSSPYDLPEDIGKSRRRPVTRTVTSPLTQAPAPPPRSSSMSGVQSAVQPPSASNLSSTSLSPPTSSQSMQPPKTGFGATVVLSSKTSKSAGEFFAELPVVPKVRSATPSASGRYTPQQSAPSNVPPPPPSVPGSRSGPPTLPKNDTQTPPASQFQRPAPLEMFPDLPAEPARRDSLPIPQASARYSPAPGSVPAVNSRYSPAPPPPQSQGPRYSPVPPMQSGGSAHARYASEPRSQPQPFAPRTSSPLAQHTTPGEQDQPRPILGSAVSLPSVPHSRSSFDSGLPGLSQVREVEESHSAPPYAPANTSTPPPPRSGPPSAVTSPQKRTQNHYAPPSASLGAPSSFTPPQRSLSQSPSATLKAPRHAMTTSERPSSAHAVPTTSTLANFPAALPRRRGFTIEHDFIVPQDERANDQLERYKGSPVLSWGAGGNIVTMFPKQIPRYGSGSSAPMIKALPGEVKLQSIKTIFPLEESMAKFPGPLRSKGKKKEVVAWLQSVAESKDQDLNSLPMGDLDRARLTERVLLWKIMALLVEHDGKLEGVPAVEQAVSKVLVPEQVEQAGNAGSFTIAADLAHTTGVSAGAQSEPVDPSAVRELRSLLSQGKRQEAVWHAADKRLWAHAFLISSTFDKSLWKQVIHEFVRKEVKKLGDDTQSLAALYEVFAGNYEECADELVPASARAGFQMVSAADGQSSTRDIHKGLDRWRETLALILSNRSEGDVQSMASLGRLLASYGRTDAAHVCFLFARIVTNVSGVDDPNATVVLFGADHVNRRAEIGRDLESILLTEVYEFASTLSSQPTQAALPHLQAYKLTHAQILAEYGFKTEAQAYCDAIAASMKATTKVSNYYHPTLLGQLDDLAKRLSQAPADSSTVFSKPNINKVSGTLGRMFSNFVAGEDSDAGSNVSGPGADEAGPFGRLSGNTPTISPSASTTNLYGAMAGVPPTSSSKYVPQHQYTPRSSMEQSQSAYPAAPGSQYGASPHQPSVLSNPYAPSTYSPPGSQGSYAPNGLYATSQKPSYGAGPYQSTAPQDSDTAAANYPTPPITFDQPSAHQPAAPIEPEQGDYQPYSSYESPSSNTFEAPSSNSYEPPSYQPYQPDNEPSSAQNEDPDSPHQSKPKKKSFMDDDDDDDEIMRRAAALKGGSTGASDKAAKDRAADEAFRKAAEADGKSFICNVPPYPLTLLCSCTRQAESRGQEGLVRRLVQERSQCCTRAYQSQAWRGKLILLRSRPQEMGQQERRCGSSQRADVDSTASKRRTACKNAKCKHANTAGRCFNAAHACRRSKATIWTRVGRHTADWTAFHWPSIWPSVTSRYACRRKPSIWHAAHRWRTSVWSTLKTAYEHEQCQFYR